jgi:uncharacterized beta-barrel protein YwiB (DUF1934 family)
MAASKKLMKKNKKKPCMFKEQNIQGANKDVLKIPDNHLLIIICRGSIFDFCIQIRLCSFPS